MHNKKEYTQMLNHPIYEQLEKRILIIDGAMGTMLQAENLTPDDFGGEELDGCNENLVITRPDVIKKVHRAYLEAGADIICTNTFGGTPLVLNEYDLGDKADEINTLAVKIAKEAASEFSTSDMATVCSRSNGSNDKNPFCYRWYYV